MTPLDLSHDDRQRLDDAAALRFHEVFPLPKDAIVLFTLDGRLLITVALAVHVDDLMDDLVLLRQMASFIFGTDDVAIWFCGVEVWHSKAESDVISEISTLPMKNMSAAILERPTETTAVVVDSVTPIDNLASEMAAITGRPIDEWRSLILNSSPALFVSVATAEALLDQQIGQLQAMKDRLKSSGSQAQNGNGRKPATEKAATRKPATRKAAAQKPAAQKSPAQKLEGRKPRAKKAAAS